MTRTTKRLLWSVGLMMSLILLLGAGPKSYQSVQATIPVVMAESEARFWVEDLGDVNSSSRGYSEEYGAVVWRVEGANTTVVMDENYDLVGLEFR